MKSANSKTRDVWIYAPLVDSVGLQRIEGEEAHHLLRVLRIQTGDIVSGTNGLGARFRAQVTQASAKQPIEIEVDDFSVSTEPHPDIRIAIAPTKSADRIEWFLEKATEIGVSQIHLIRTDHSERNQYRTDRGERILIAAMKQSKRTLLPTLHPMKPLRELVIESGYGWIAHCHPGEKEHFARALQNTTGPHTILIGPEGDFSEAEIDLAAKNNIKSITLGNRRLRTETAGIIAAEWTWLNHFK